MKLSECTPGTMVTTDDNRVGIIIGLTNNMPMGNIEERRHIFNAIPEVKWSSGEVTGIHHENLVKFVS